MPGTSSEPYLYPLPLPDVVHTAEPLLPAPEAAEAGQCFCCRAQVRHRFILPESLPLKQLCTEVSDVSVRLERASAALSRIRRRPPPSERREREKQRQAIAAAQRALEQASLAARRLALRHIPRNEITEHTALTVNETAALQNPEAPYQLCAFCHAWHALNGYAAAQGAMVWLPDLHPSTVVAVNRQALQAIFSADRALVRRGREVLSALLQSRLAVEDKYRSFRPADFADVLRRHPPARRATLREKMSGVALILTPDSFVDQHHAF